MKINLSLRETLTLSRSAKEAEKHLASAGMKLNAFVYDRSIRRWTALRPSS